MNSSDLTGVEQRDVGRFITAVENRYVGHGDGPSGPAFDCETLSQPQGPPEEAGALRSRKAPAFTRLEKASAKERSPTR